MKPAKPDQSIPYGAFAEIYDRLMCSVDYEAWADYVEQLLAKANKKPKTLVDLACGTGSSTLPFARRGYRTAGVDLSAEMLSQARQKTAQNNLQVEFFQQDLRCLNLPGRFDLAVLFQDGLNYILNKEELFLALGKINAVLNDGGLFIFDLTRPGLRCANQNGSCCCAEMEELTLIMESYFAGEEDLWSARLTVFQEVKPGLFRKYVEEHREKDYTPELVKDLLGKAGFTVPGIYASFSLERGSSSDQKLTFLAEKGSEP